MTEDPFDELRRHMHRFVEQMSPFAAPSRAASGSWRPAVDVYETADAVVVVMDLAGVPPEDLKLELEGRTLLVSGTRSTMLARGARRIHHLEIPYGRFRVAIELPALVDVSRSEAASHNGLLEVVLPRPRPVRPRVESEQSTPSGGR